LHWLDNKVFDIIDAWCNHENPVFLSLLLIEPVGRSGQKSSVIPSYFTAQFSRPRHSHTCDMHRHVTVSLRRLLNQGDALNRI